MVPCVPIQPGDFIVLAIGVVVAPLRSPDLIPARQHRDAPGQEQRGQQISFLLLAAVVDLRIVGWAFDAVVVAVIVVGAVAIVFHVGLVVFVIVADQILQSKSVVAGDVIDACAGRAGVWKKVRTAAESLYQVFPLAGVSAPEFPDGFAELIVPDRPL